MDAAPWREWREAQKDKHTTIRGFLLVARDRMGFRDTVGERQRRGCMEAWGRADSLAGGE